MTGRERVLKAASLQGEPDRVPWGELGVEPCVLRRFIHLPEKASGDTPLSLDEEAEAIRALGLDIVPVDSSQPGFEERIRWFSRETDLFVMCVTGGGFYDCMARMGFTSFLVDIRARRGDVESCIREAVKRNTAIAERASDAGASGIMVGDDIAYNKGTYASPRDLRELLFPLLASQAEAIERAGALPMFHSDGDLRAVFPDIIQAGFRVIHCLEPSAGMDLGLLKREYGSRVCLMGNIDMEVLATEAEASVESAVREAISAGAPGGGFIISTSSGVLGGRIPPGHLAALRRAITGLGSTPTPPQ